MIYALKEYVTHLEYWKLDSKKLNIYIHIFRNRMAAPINRTRITKEHVERTSSFVSYSPFVYHHFF